MKFGGTSVGSAGNMRRVRDIITGRNATVTVLSAMSGTTDALVEICRLAGEGADRNEIGGILETLRKKYAGCIDALLVSKKDEARELLYRTLELIADASVWYRGEASGKLIIAQGELLTSAIFAMFMQESGFDAVLLDATGFMRKDSEGKVDTGFLKARIVESTAARDAYYITQGFICTDHNGNIDNLGRGGSDYTAALTGAALDAEAVEIWTDIDGIHNNDPRYVENTYPIRRMNFDEAAELAYFGAKIIHPATVIPCKEKGIPVLLKDTLEPDAEGTLIADDDEPTGRAYHAVAAKDGIIAVRIHSARMLMAYGFLRRVFEIFEKYRTPIDMITTSEVAVSLTVDCGGALDRIVEELQPLGTIEVERGNTIVCVVGSFGHNACGVASDVLEGVDTIPVKMISYGASDRSMAMLIDTKYKKEFLQKLNDSLFADHA